MCLERGGLPTQHSSDRLFCTGLTIAAGNANKFRIFLALNTNASGSVQRLYNIWHNDLQKCSGDISGRLSTKNRPSPSLCYHGNKTMSINALTLYGNKKVSRPNLAAIVMRGRK